MSFALQHLHNPCRRPGESQADYRLRRRRSKAKSQQIERRGPWRWGPFAATISEPSIPFTSTPSLSTVLRSIFHAFHR